MAKGTGEWLVKSLKKLQDTMVGVAEIAHNEARRFKDHHDTTTLEVCDNRFGKFVKLTILTTFSKAR